MRANTIPLKELCENYRQDIVDGPFGSNLKREDYRETGIPVLKIQNVKPFRITLKKMDYVERGKFIELSRHSYTEGDIVMTKLGAPLGVCAIVSGVEDGLIVADLVRIRAKKINTRYLNYHLNSPITNDFINSKQKGTTRPRVRIEDVRNLPIFVPSSEEQERIVAILDEAFEAIDKAKQNTEKNLQNARELFDSCLSAVDAEKKPVGDLVEIKTGKLDANAAVENGRYPFFTCSREISAIDAFAFDTEAILLAGNNASGDFNVKHYEGRFNAYQRTYVITIPDKSKLAYRYLYFQMLKGLKQFKTQAVGANTKFLKLGMIKDLQIELPELPQQLRIVEGLDSLTNETKKLESIYRSKMEHCDELKRSLLQKAFNGRF